MTNVLSGSGPDEVSKVIFSKESVPDWPARDPAVRKVVLGEPPFGREKKPLQLAELPPDFADRLPGLTHLYLWQIAGLKKLPALPPGLDCLDVRGCADLTELPALPPTLETLDLGGCAGLQRLPREAPPELKRFFFDGCATLEDYSLAAFLVELGRQLAPVEEVDGSGCPAVTSLARFPKTTLRKLVFKGCARLTDVSQLPGFPVLEHLNLGACTELGTLPDLPPLLRFLVLHGAENLRAFMGQDVGPYDRGKEGQNVAKAFLSRKKFGKDLAIMPHAKLLLMGDGRVGKTTLAKRLQWEELGQAQRRLPANRDLEPSPTEPFNHKIHFWHWETGLSLPENEAKALDERAKAAGIALLGKTGGLLDGAVRIWDFGGQEIYHSTHRIFAGEGSIFLVVWREDQPDPGPAPDGAKEYWDEWNRQRPLDYWLDYIYSMRPAAKVALVCTNCPDPDAMARKPDWKARAPKHADRDLPAFFVDSLDPACGQHREYQRLVRWIREACGEEARRIGILQPRFYREVSDLLDGWLAENSQTRQDEGAAEHLLCPWAEWQESVRTAHRHTRRGSGSSLDENDIAVITDYLHQAGHLFQIRHERHRAILVDQEWAAELIYRLLLCGGPLWTTVRGNGGWFYGATLEADLLWKALDDDMQRQRLLAYMQECRVVTRISEAGKNCFGKDVYLASNKWLLPEYASRLEERVEREMRLLREQAGVGEREKFEFEDLTLSEFDFRSLQAQLARTFGTRAVYFRNGFQAADAGEDPDWCFRARWLPDEKDPFAGKIDAVLVARKPELERLGVEIEDLFHGEGSPIPDRRRTVRRGPADECDLGHAYFRSVRADEYDIAVSSSGADAAEAEAMVKALRLAGLKVNWYRTPECRAGDRERLLTFMHSLGRSPCIVLLVSEGYLLNDPAANWYCGWELADAIRRVGDGAAAGAGSQPELPWPHIRRKAEQTLVVFKESGGFSFGRFDPIVFKLLEDMGTYFHGAYSDLDVAELDSFRYYDEFSRHFAAARRPEVWRRFMDAHGALGSAMSYASAAGGKGDFSTLLAKCEKCTGKKRTG